jgi:hypothetical protein
VVRAASLFSCVVKCAVGFAPGAASALLAAAAGGAMLMLVALALRRDVVPVPGGAPVRFATEPRRLPVCEIRWD